MYGVIMVDTRCPCRKQRGRHIKAFVAQASSKPITSKFKQLIVHKVKSMLMSMLENPQATT